MPDTSAEALCTECGLCCDGTLFADVELRDRKEAVVLEILGLEIEEEGSRHLLVQPCRALQNKRCEIYPHRPECCQTFECAILKKLRSGELSSSIAHNRIADLKRRLNELEPCEGRSVVENEFLS